MAADLLGSKDLRTHKTSALSTKMNQVLKSLYAEQRSVNKKYIVEDRTGQGQIKIQDSNMGNELI